MWSHSYLKCWCKSQENLVMQHVKKVKCVVIQVTQTITTLHTQFCSLSVLVKAMLTSYYQLNPFSNDRTAIWSWANVHSWVRHMNIWDNQKSLSVIKSSVSWQITTFLAPLYCYRYLNTKSSIYSLCIRSPTQRPWSSIMDTLYTQL